MGTNFRHVVLEREFPSVPISHNGIRHKGLNCKTLTLFPLAIRGSNAGATITIRPMRACSTSTTTMAIVTATIRFVLLLIQLLKFEKSSNLFYL